MNLRRTTFLILPAVAILSGCAMFNKYDYRSVEAQPPQPAGKGSIAVAVVDARPDFLSKDVDADYVGMTRSGFGIPYRVTTKSKAALADDLAFAMAKSLRDGGWNARSVSNYSVSSTDAARAALAQTGASRFILVTLRAWESDTLINTDLTVDVDLSVLDASGKTLATTHYVEAKSLGGSAMPEQYAREHVLSETGKILSGLLQTPTIKAAL